MIKLHRFLATIVLAIVGTAMAWAVDQPGVSFDSSTRTYTLSCGTTGATIWYTVDGTDPKTATKRYKYTGPFQVNRTLTIWAAAEKDGEWSAVNDHWQVTVESKFLYKNIYYQLVANTLDDVVEVASRQSGVYEGDIVIPSTVPHASVTYTVIRIGNQAFYDADYITGISLPTTITSIGTYAFYNCDRLYNITLPASVKTVGESAFSNCYNLKDISLNEGLETIENSAFANCSQLTAITLPNTLKSLGYLTFNGCSRLTAVRIPDSVTSIGYSLFENCSALTSVTLPATLTDIPNATFNNCYSLRSISIPSTVKSIGESAFHNCDALTSVTIPEGVETLGFEVFHQCDNLLSVSIPEGVTVIPVGAFDDDFALSTVSLPTTLTTISERAFNTCRSLKTITIPENVTSIGKRAFTECENLTSVYALPMNPPEMSSDNDGNAFLDILQQATLYVKSSALNNYKASNRWDEFQTKQTIDNVLCEQPTFALSDYVLTMSTATAGATIYYTTDGSDPTTASIAYTGPIPFMQNGTIRAIAVKEGMDNSAISEFVKSNYKTPAPVATIDENFVVNITCESPDIEGFPETKIYYIVNIEARSWGWQTIAQGNNDWQLYEGPIQLEGPRYVHVYAVREGWNDSETDRVYDYYSDYQTTTPWIEWVNTKNKIRLYNYDADATVYYTLDGTDPTAESAVYNPDDSIAINRDVIIKCIAMRPGHFDSDIASQTITNVAQTFYEGGFYYRLRDNMTADEVEVTRGENHQYQGDVVIERYVEHNGTKFAVTRIGNNAFYDNEKLTSVTLHDGINSIGVSAFQECDALTAVDVPGSVKSIEREAFRSCINLRAVTLHEGLETIGNAVFYNCYNLPSLTLPNTLKTIGESAFQECRGFREFYIPDGVTSIGNRAFDGCTALVSIHLSAALSAISYSMFSSCSSLLSIDIPASVKTIEYNAFRDCYALVSVSLPVGLETLGESVFNGCRKLLSVTIPEGVTLIPNYAFYDCYALTTVSLPTSLQTIGYTAFQNCSSMQSITLPENLTTIGTGAFSNCNNLSDIYCLGQNAPTLDGGDGDQAFANVVTHATLHVKKAAEGNYKVARHWNKFTSFEVFDNIMAAQPTFKLENYKLSISTATDGASIYYTTDGTEPTTASPQYTAPINFWSNGIVKAIAVKDGLDNSLVGEFKKEDMKVAMPVVTMDENFKVTMTCEQPDIEGFPEVRIKYVVNDNTYGIDAGDERWQLYDGTPIQLTRPSYVHYYAEREGWISTEQAYEDFNSAYYTNKPSIEWNPYTQKAYIYSYESYFPADATVYYTLDGSDPTRESLVYNPSDSILIVRNLIVKAFAVRPRHFDSDIATGYITDVTQTFSKDGIYYRLVDNVLTNEVEVTRGSKDYEGDLVIPDKITYAGVKYDVTRIGESALGTGYYNSSQVTSVILPPTIRSIGKWAFSAMNMLTELDIPASVVTIEEGAFNETSLKKVTLHEGLETIEKNAFYRSTQLTNVTLPQTLKTIGNEAFAGCSEFTHMDIPESVTSIGESAFSSCSKLESVTLSSGLTELANGIFQSSALKSVIIPNGVTSIGSKAFYNCGYLSSVTIPASVQTIKSEAFRDCRSLTSISIPEGVTAIENYTFAGCNLLTTIQLPSTLTTIGQYAFYNCAVMPNVTLPENLKTIDTYAFHGCTVLNSVYSLAATPPTLNGDGNTNAFATMMGEATLYTKSGDKEKYENANLWSSFKELVVFDNVPCAQPTFTLENFRLTMKSNTEGATIYYTTDDSEPSTESLKYTAPIALLQNDTIRAIAVAEGFSPSVISDFRKADYKVDVPTVSLSDDLVMTITYGGATEELAPVRIYYKENTDRYSPWGDKPWILYEGPIQLMKPRYYRVMAQRDGWLDSDESDTYDYYTNYRLDAPQMSWSKDETTGIGTMTLSYYNNNSEGDFYYTLDGSDPTKENGTLYTEPIQIVRNLTVKAVAWKEKHCYSEIASWDVTDVSRTFYVDNIWYRLTDKSLGDEVEVTNGNIPYEGDVNIPATVTIQGTKYNVVGIGNSALSDQDKVTSVTLPASIRYIGNGAFYDVDNLQTIVVPEAVKTIGSNAFYNCDRLASVTLHEGLESIDESAFNSLPALKTIVIPSTVMTIGNAAFSNCTSLASITLPAGLKVIPNDLFRYNKKLADITLPTALDLIGNYAFSGTAITTMQLPTSVTAIGDGAFHDCAQLSNIVIPESVTELAQGLFENCHVLTSVSLPTTLQRVGSRSFRECFVLESIVLPASLKTIGAAAFNRCTKLMTIYSMATTPAIIEGNAQASYEMERDAFYDVKQTAKLFVPETAVEAYKNKQFWQEFGDRIVGSDLVPCEQPTFELTDFKLTIQSLTEGASIYYTNDGSNPDVNAIPYTAPVTLLKNDTILAVAVKDGMAASPIAKFYKNDYKVNVPVATLSDDLVMTITCEIPEVEGLPETKLYYKENFRDGYWNETEWKLYEGPVQMTQPRYIMLMAKRDGWVDSDESNIYNYYTNYRLEKPKIVWSSENKEFTITKNNADAHVYYTLDGTMPTAENGTLYTEPVSLIRNLQIKAVAVQDKHFNSEVDSVKVEGVNFQFMADGVYYRLLDYTLENNVEVVRPQGVTYSGNIVINPTVTYKEVEYTVTGIAKETFYDCDGLTSIKLPATLQTIGSWAFYSCSNLEEIEIPVSVKTITYRMLSECTNLKQVVLHDGLETIEEYAFAGCSSISEIEIPNSVQLLKEYTFNGCSKLEKVVLPTQLEEIPNYAFAGTSIMGIDIPSTVKRIGDNAFNGCRQLRSMALPEGIIEIARYTFYECVSMTTVELPSTLQTIDSYAFCGNRSLENIILPATLASIGSSAFSSCTSIDRIYSLAANPPSLPDNNNPFGDVTSTATLYVLESPNDDVRTAYKQTKYWGDFNNGKGIQTFKDIPCAQPTFAYENFMLSMESKTAGVSIFYTTDNTEPTVNSIPYLEPIAVLKNDTIRAMAIGEGWGQSLTSVFRKNDYKVATPETSITSDFVVSFSCESPDVQGLPETKIYYNQNRSSYQAGEEWTLYQEPFKMLTAGYIHVKAVRDGWIESDVSHNDYYTNYYLEKPIFSPNYTSISYMPADTTITLSHSQENVQIYYTLDGTDPNVNGVLYTAPIKPQHNVNVVAIAKREGSINSDPEQREYKWFTVPTPTITIEHLAAVMKVEKPEYAKIYYTLDNSEPTIESTLYTEPVALNKDCKIKAIAIADKWNDSSVESFNSPTGFLRKDYTVVTPAFGTRQVVDGVMVENADSVLNIKTTTADATIYYTLDGSTPTVNSLKYENGIKLTENCIVKAFAAKEDMFDSEMIEAEVEWFTVKQPHIVFNGKYVEMSDDTEDAVVYYTIDGTTPDTKSKVYQKPFALEAEQIVVRAIGVKEDWKNSEVSSLTYNPGKNYCETPGITRIAGTNKVQMTTRTEGAKIYFTSDGLNPTVNSTLYTAEIEVTDNCTLKAMAADSLLYDSEVTTFIVDWFKADQPAITAAGIFVTITAPKEGSRIYYTLDGSEPTTGSTLYEGTLTMKGSCTIKAIAAFDNFNNSSVAVFNYYASDYTCGLPTFTREGNTVSIASNPVEGTTIYYTLDGTTPSTASSVFTEPIAVDHNITIKAMAVNDKLFTSEVADYEVNWFTTDAPVIAFDGIFATMTCATPNSRIYYTLDGSSPTAESFLFTSAITMTGSCTVKAIAMRDNFNNSAVTSVSFDKASNTVAMPQFKRNGNLITITTSTMTEGTTIYYTVDASEPTAESAVYSEPVPVVENCTLKAVAMNDKLYASETSSFNIDWFKVETPVLSINGNTLTMSCGTPGAVIYYEYDDIPTLKSTVYNGPITLVDNRTIFAIAVKENFNDSEMAGATPDIFVCTEPTFAYNGRYLQVETGEGMTIHYTTDGSKPTEDSEVCTGQIEIKDVCTVRAIATRKDFRDSPESIYNVTYVYTGEEASQSEAGHLADMFQWIGSTENVESLPVSGKVNADDLKFIRSIKSLRHLDMTESTYEGTALPDEAFAGMQLISYQSPKQLSAAGDHLFRGCDQLAAVVWNANITVPETAIEDIKHNPNFLLYVNSRIYAPSSYKGNLISGGQASSITLQDTESGENFCCPVRFYTQQISYTHNYSQDTEEGETCGWETISLPFDVQSITHEKRGSLAPFAKGEDVTQFRPFWLYELKETGFSRASEIQAYTPYIISMPNSPNYADDYILAGNVTFTATNTYVEADMARSAMKGSLTFAPAMQRQEKSENVLAINLEDYTDDDQVFHRSGSAFVPNMRMVRPFEAYAVAGGAGARSLDLNSYLWGDVTDMMRIEMDKLIDIAKNRRIFDLSGRRVSETSVKNKAKLDHQRIYIINGKKTVVK